MIKIEYNAVSSILTINGIEKNSKSMSVLDYDVQSIHSIYCGIQYLEVVKNILIGNGCSILSRFEYKKILDIIEKYFRLTNQEYKIEILPKRFRLNESGLRY